MDIGASIKKLRTKNGITQCQLAEYLNVSPQTVSRWETSATCPDVVMLPILAKCFRVSVDCLLNIGGNVMTPVESDRLLIREWHEIDAADLFEIRRSSKNFMDFLRFASENDSLDAIKIWKEYGEMYPVILKETGRLVGVAGLVDVNRYKGYRELEVHICDKNCEVGLVTEAHKLMLGCGFDQLGLLAAFAYCGCQDEIFRQAMLNTGFVYEGTLRKFGRDGSDRLRFSVLKDEFVP